MIVLNSWLTFIMQQLTGSIERKMFTRVSISNFLLCQNSSMPLKFCSKNQKKLLFTIMIHWNNFYLNRIFVSIIVRLTLPLIYYECISITYYAIHLICHMFCNVVKLKFLNIYSYRFFNLNTRVIAHFFLLLANSNTSITSFPPLPQGIRSLTLTSRLSNHTIQSDCVCPILLYRRYAKPSRRMNEGKETVDE